MTLATILVTFFLALGPANAAVQDQTAPAPQAQAPAAQKSSPDAASGTQQNPQPAPKPHTRRKKVSTPDCSTSAASSSATSTTKSADAPAATQAANPCPPKKVVVKNGGSDEPTVQLNGDTPAAKASNDLSTTEQLRLATEDNLRKIAGRQLSANQQDTVNQIKQFLEQSKAAVDDGDLERGHNLAMKARLLSDELLAP